MDTADWMPIVLTFLAGILVGWGAAYAFGVLQARTAKDLANTWFREHEDQLKASFGDLSLSALSRSTEEFLKLAKAKLDSEREVGAKDLDSKKALIDQQLQQMTVELEKVSRLVSDLERDRVEKFGELTTQLKNQTEQTSALIQTATSLREALSSTKARGQWGERMAEDVLRLAGLLENINYVKQRALEGSGGRPDFTFLLPRNLKLNMDVKFPLDNYLRYVEAASETDRGKYRTEFLRDVRARIKEVTTRDYIDPEQGTVDSVLVFIPNEQIYAFIHEQDSSILDDAIRHSVVLCSPLTLFAILAVIRKAIDNFTLEQTSNEILSLLGAFKKQWDAFVSKLEVLGRRIGDAQREYEAITSTRRRQLEKPLQRLEDIRTQRG
ncbi:MAG: DNA recombination protein RmuC, partial [Nitrospirales bacterium]